MKYKIVTSDTCTYCVMAKKLMENFNIDYEEENISKDKNLAQTIKEKLLKESNIESRIVLQQHDDDAKYQQQFAEMIDKYTFHADEE